MKIKFETLFHIVCAALFGYIFGLINGFGLRIEMLESFMEFFKRIR